LETFFGAAFLAFGVAIGKIKLIGVVRFAPVPAHRTRMYVL
jgi:hypothetical protein